MCPLAKDRPVYRPAGIGPHMVKIVGIFIAARDGEHAGAQDVGSAVRDQHRIARVGINGASFPAISRRRSAAASSITPPSDVRRPPSKAATTFLRAVAGKLNGLIVSFEMAGVARDDRVNGVVSTPNS